MSQYSYDGDGNRMSMIIDLAYGPNGRQGNNGNNGNGNNNGNGSGNGNSASKCTQVVPAGFVPPGLAKKCGQVDNPNDYPTANPGGPRDGREQQYKEKHQEVHYTNDVSVALPEPIQATGEDATKWKETYTYGAGGDRISMTYLPANDPNNGWAPSLAVSGAQPGTAPKRLYYLSDALGSTLDMETQDGRVSSRYHYDEFGVPTDAKKFDPNWPGPDNLFGYTGLGYDYTSGLTYARARYYQPELGRFISEDTYKGTLGNPQSQNGYAYVENNPLTNIDPSGHWCEAIVDGNYYSHAGGCNDGKGGNTRTSGDGYTIDSVHNGEYEWGKDGRGSQYFNPGAPHITDPLGISQAVIGCATDNQCSGFIGGATVSEVKSVVQAVVSLSKSLFGGSKAEETTSTYWTRDNRMAEFNNWVENGLEVDGEYYFGTQHFIYSLKKSGRKDIMPDQVVNALRQTPKAGSEPYTWIYTDPNSGVQVIVNENNMFVGIQPKGFKN